MAKGNNLYDIQKQEQFLLQLNIYVMWVIKQII